MGYSDNMLEDASVADAGARSGLMHELAELLVESLNLEVPAEQLDPQAPLYRDGLGLDSIDILELALVVSKRYGVQLRADDAGNMSTFASLKNLAEFIGAHRTK